MSAFDLRPEQAAENFADLAEELLYRSAEETVTDAAGKEQTKSLAMQQLEATRAQVAVQLATFHSFHVRQSDKPSWQDVAEGAGFGPDGKFVQAPE